MKKTTLIIRGQPAPQGGGHHGLRYPTRPVVIRNMQGEVIARLGEEQGCTDDLSTAFLDELDLSNANLEGANLSDAYIGILQSYRRQPAQCRFKQRRDRMLRGG